MTSFEDVDAAMRMRSLIASIVAEELAQIRPADRFGTVNAVSEVSSEAEVIFDGETDPIIVRFDSVNKPTSTTENPVPVAAAADRVRVTGKPGNYWITQIITGVASVLPPGVMVEFLGASTEIPTGWLLCDGTELLIDTYPLLYKTLTSAGTVFPYGTNTNGSGGAGTTHFKLPNMKGQVPVGVHTGITEFNLLGKFSGNLIQQLTEANLPEHAHGIDHNHASFNTASGGSHTHNANFTQNLGGADNDPGPIRVGASTANYNAVISGSSTGSDHVHAIDVPNFTGTSGLGSGTAATFSILQPAMAVHFIVKT